jgi:adenylylsulfate kinase
LWPGVHVIPKYNLFTCYPLAVKYQKRERGLIMVDDGSQKLKLTWNEQTVTREALEALHGHRGFTVWFTGLSASGKSTLANAVATHLHDRRISTYVLDGDNVRHALNNNLGFSPVDRTENIRRIGEVGKLFSTAGIVNLTAFISPYQTDRRIAREMQPDSFVEVYCAASLDVCEARDPKGLYREARAGNIKEFTGVSAPYEAPEAPEISVDTGTKTVEQCVSIVVTYLEERGFISPGNGA